MGAIRLYREFIVKTCVIILIGSKKLITMSNVTGVDRPYKNMSPLVSISLQSESTSESWKSKSKLAMSTMAAAWRVGGAEGAESSSSGFCAAELAQTTAQAPAACRRGLWAPRLGGIGHWSRRWTSCGCSIPQNTNCTSPFLCRNEEGTSWPRATVKIEEYCMKTQKTL